MANRNFNWRPNWLTATLGAAIGLVIASSLVLAPSEVQAVHDEPTPFQLDGNPSKGLGGGNPGVNLMDDDWDNVFDLGGIPYPATRQEPNDIEAEGEVFVNDTLVDANGDELTAFIKSNKDTHDTDTWDWDADPISPPKNDITNAYAKAYRVDHDNSDATPDHLIVYFGSDRYADDGDAAMGYWFFRNAVGPGPNNKFAGKHAVGDILIQIDYRGAGANEIEVFKWVGTGGNAGSGTLQRLAIGTSNNPADTICTAASTGIPEDSACITTNVVSRDSPWAYVPKGQDSVGDNRFPARTFMEGGFDVTALVGNVCFSGFMAETRSSHSETAELKDFAFGDFDLCSISVAKECVPQSQTLDGEDETFTTTHLVTITNDGFSSSLRDVALSDTAVGPASATDTARSCTIMSVELLSGTASGLAGVGSVFDASSDSVEVADSLSGAISVELECTAGINHNPFVNSVAVMARAGVGLPQDITDSFSEDPDDTVAACQLNLTVGLNVKKWCQGDNQNAASGTNPYFYGIAPGAAGYNPLDPRVDPENPLELGVFLKSPAYAPEVCVDIEISNPSADQKMVVDSFEDDRLGSLLPAGGLTLNTDGASGDSYFVSRCYTPSGPDGADGDPVNPGTATYTDTVTAHATGKIDGKEKSAGPVSATCGLCPTCPCLSD